MYHSTQRLAKLIAITALGALCGCTDEPVFEKLFSTDHFDYYVEQGATSPCDGTGEWLERYYAVDTNFFGVNLPSGEKIEYYHVKRSETMDLIGCPSVNGCTQQTKIYDTFLLTAHEIVHATGSLKGYPPFLFQEGLAEVLSCGSSSDWLGYLDTSAPIENLIESKPFFQWRMDHGSDVYGAAESFVRYVMDRFGVDKFLAFYASASKDDTRDETCAIFEKEMGVRLDDALADWRKMPPQLSGDVCMQLMGCDTSIPEFTNGDVNVGCGPTGGFFSTQEALYRFQVAEGKTMHLVTTPSVTQPQPRSRVSLLRCLEGEVLGYDEFTAGYLHDKEYRPYIDPTRSTRRFVLDMPHGDYVAWFSADAKTEIHAELIESGNLMRDGCMPAAEPLTLSDKEEAVLTSRWMERPCNGFWCPGYSWDVAIGPTGGAIGLGRFVNGDTQMFPDEVYLCSDPCPTDADQCEIVPIGGALVPASQSKKIFAPGTVVHIGAPLAPLKEHFSLRMRLIPPCNGRVPCSDPWHGPR